MRQPPYMRFIEAHDINVRGKKIFFSVWHCLVVTSPLRIVDDVTKVQVTDCRGHVVEVPHRDLCAWSKIHVLEKDFELKLSIGETVEISDPSSSDGETVIVVDRDKREIRVPVGILSPTTKHSHEHAPHAV